MHASRGSRLRPVRGSRLERVHGKRTGQRGARAAPRRQAGPFLSRDLAATKWRLSAGRAKPQHVEKMPLPRLPSLGFGGQIATCGVVEWQFSARHC